MKMSFGILYFLFLCYLLSRPPSLADTIPKVASVFSLILSTPITPNAVAKDASSAFFQTQHATPMAPP